MHFRSEPETENHLPNPYRLGHLKFVKPLRLFGNYS